MMERNYPSSSFSDPLAPSAQTAAWAYERAGLKPSLSYGSGPSEADLLHRQAYTAAQLPAYSATHHPTGLAGIFDTSLHGAGINTTETSVMNFLSAIESRTAASSGTTLLPQFRAASWQTAMHSTADLFVTGALPTSGTFPPTSALSAYQHPSTFSTRNFATTPTLTLQDGTFSAASNGLLAHDPLLQLKSSQCTIPTALTFDRLGSSVLTSSLPPQSSTYRSAQESAPHLLQPQFSLLPSALAGAQQVSQAYSPAVFAGSTGSIERVLQRECSVIKHHQRPSSTQSVQAQLAGSHHSLQTYLSSASGIHFPDTSRQSTLSCSPLADITQVSNGGLQQKTSRVTVELAQSYTSAIPSSGYPLSSAKGKNCSTKPPPISTKTSKPQSVVLPVQTQSYAKSAQSQSSVISTQAQIYSTAQLPSLLSVSQSQTFISTQSPNIPTISDSQTFSSIKSEKLPSLYKTMNSYSAQSQAITSDSQTVNYSTGQQHSLPSISNENYSDQARNLSSATPSQSYTSSQSQGLSPLSQSPINYSSQSHADLSVSSSVSYSSGQNLSSSPSLQFSSSSGVQNLSTSSPSQNYISIPPSQSSRTQDSTSPQSQTFLPTSQSPFTSPTLPQTLLNSRINSDVKTFATEGKLHSSMYSSAKQEAEFQMQDLQALQQHNALDSSTRRPAEHEIGDPESAYRVSKADEKYHSPSVIRSSSRIDDQGIGLSLQGSKRDGRMVSSVAPVNQHIGHIDSVVNLDLKHTANLLQTSHDRVHGKELNQQSQVVNKVHETKIEENVGNIPGSPRTQTPALRQAEQVTLPNAQALLESACDLELLQQSIFGQTKTSTPGLLIHSTQQITHPFLQMETHDIHNNRGQTPHQTQPQNSDMMKMDITGPAKSIQQQKKAIKDNFRHQNTQDSKNQFISLSSMCFPESMLLTDERNILSNVDDILAATAAACGVTTQEFAKAASNNENMSVENGNDLKPHYQSDVGPLSPSFNTSQVTVEKYEGINAESMNAGQMLLNLSQVATVHSKNIPFAKKHIELSDQSLCSGITSSAHRPGNEEHVLTSATVNRPQNTNSITEGNRDGQDCAFSNIKDQNYSCGNSLQEETSVSDNDFNRCIDNDNIANNETNILTPKSTDPPSCNNSGNTTEDDNKDTAPSNIQTNQETSHLSNKSVPDDENANQKQTINDPLVKRQISKAIDISLPCSPADIADSYFDSFQHQERIRQKIKEVEEQQPEVKSGFIGSFLDFLKGEPKLSPPPKVPSRTKRPAAPILRAPFLQHVPFKNLPLMSPVSPLDIEHTETQKIVEDGSKKNLETLPSFSSSDEDSGGGRDLQNSISTALSALDDTSDRKNKAESEKVPTASLAPDVKQEPPGTFSPAIKVEENPKAIETPTLPVVDANLIKPQGTVAFEGFTEDEQSDSGGEGTFRERDEFVVKLEDVDALKLALSTGQEPPAIWRVQKALLQKFVPEVRNGQRQYSATNSYLGYFGDAKSKYKRLYAKFIETANKKEYVRICSRKPTSKPTPSARTGQTKLAGNKTHEPHGPKSKAKQPKTKAEPPPKKRKTWKEECTSFQPDKPLDVQMEKHGNGQDSASSHQTNSSCGTVRSISSEMDVASLPTLKELPPPPKQPLPSVEQPLPSVEQPLPSVEQPLPSVEQPLPSVKQPLPSVKQPLPSVKQPLPSVEQPLPSVEQPLPSVEQPLPSVEQPLPSVNQPLPSVEQPLPSVEQPLPSVEQPLPLTKQPLPSTKQPLLPTKLPLPSKKQPVPSKKQPSPSTKQPSPSIKQPSPSTKQPSLSTKRQPVALKEPQPALEQLTSTSAQKEALPPAKRARPPAKRTRPPPKRARPAKKQATLLAEEQQLPAENQLLLAEKHLLSADLQPPSAEPQPPSAEPQPPSAEPQPPSAEPQPPSAEPQPPSAEPQLPSAEPQLPSAEPQLPSADPQPTPSEQQPQPSEQQPPVSPKQLQSTPRQTPSTPRQTPLTPETPPNVSARALRTRAMKETFRSYMELLVSMALDADTMQALETSNDELLLPHMRKIDGMLDDSQRKVLEKLNLQPSHKSALEMYPELTVISRENKSRKGATSVTKIKVNGKAYHKKTLQNVKSSSKSSKEFTVQPERTPLMSLYHSLHHYKYHMFLICKDEISTVVKTSEDVGQEQIMQMCMKNMTWVETLFERFGELLSDVQERCS
ncbi:glutamine and serine-rich protein 1 isoform X2 [Lissotriton helveticus]